LGKEINKGAKMFTSNYEHLFLWLDEDIRIMDEFQKVIGLDPIRYSNELKEWVEQKAIKLKICPTCMSDLCFLPPTLEHVITAVCKKCNREFDYFSYGKGKYD
jgi:hypothetical protein